ncbi:unnamed protein product [Hymenolepis diminuta]|uniref:G_PROTEIN_RECEP_F1_2 domain-containing protein n=1 Tax=Hymenolepis diminuta TaxID=6216 RepID=A0A0R3SU60_HYMDI|nr:unnamed protein product [Hymenolepis diminuta]
MTQIPVGKQWCFSKNARLIEDNYLSSTDKLRSFFNCALLILPSLSSILALCNSAAILRICVRAYYENGPYLISYCLLKFIAVSLVCITALPRFAIISNLDDAEQKLSAQVPALLMTQQSFRLAVTWLICFLLLSQVLILNKLVKSVLVICGFPPRINGINSCNCINPFLKPFANKACHEQQENCRSYGHSIISIGSIAIFSTLLVAPQIGNYQIEADRSWLKWCVKHNLGSPVYEYTLSVLTFLLPGACFLVLILILSIKVVKISRRTQRCAYLSAEESEEKRRETILRESKFLALLGLIEFISWLPITAQDNLHRQAWIRNADKEDNVWMICEIGLIVGDLLSQALLATKIIYELAICSKSTSSISSRDGEAETTDLQISRHYTSADDSLEPLYTSQTSSQNPNQRKSVLHVRLSPPPLPSPNYTYKELEFPGQETFEFSSDKMSCFYRENHTLPFSYAFSEHEELPQCELPVTEGCFASSNGVLVSHL